MTATLDYYNIPACGKEAASGFIAELEEQYKKRPALLEELGKIK